MVTIIGIAGSLRRGLYNASLLRAAAAAAPEGVTIEIASIREVPLYDGDLEAEQGIPPGVRTLKDQVASAAGLLIATPEYNAGVPGVLKNAIDWMSRPPADIARVFRDRPVGLVGASTSRAGTILSQAAWLPILQRLGMRVYAGGSVRVPEASKAFGPDGAITDERIAEQVKTFVAGFAAFCAERR